MSPQIQAPGLAERLRRRFEIVGSSAIDTIAPELVGVVVVDELIPAVDRTEGRMSVNVTGDANDIPEIGLTNLDPVRSLVIEEFYISSTSTGQVSHRALGVQGTPVAGGVIQAADLRRDFLVPALSPTSSDNNTVTGGGDRYWQQRILANTGMRVISGVVLAPAGFLFGAIARDLCHWDLAVAAGQLHVAVLFHFLDPGLTPGR